MILVDANLLLYAKNSSLAQHERARAWWDNQLSGADPVGLSWQTITAFLRISTNPRLFPRPLSIHEAAATVESWLAQPCVRILQPTSKHWLLFRGQLHAVNAQADLVMDAFLAALAVEHACELCSTDTDFARFPGLRWRNPLD